ncbi:MAG: SusC/RagA family TonB-linked outer membrane protein [Prevotella sp.]|nr:SusC/RagA family TonB-linked outer membrane protein [Prevotella sp.]MBP3842246.1 SusC/RagA family TonB-linked outer membrane protein [Prevotella sp.]
MKSTIFFPWQNVSRRLLFCTVAFGLCASPVLAQNDDDDEEETETAIKQPTRKTTNLVKYPTVTINGIVTEQGTGKPLSGIQLQALGYVRYTAMTGEDGKFSIKVPDFATSLYVHAPEYMSQQVAIIAGDSTQHVAIRLLKDKFLPMYGTGTNYTAKSEALITNTGLTVDNEVSEKLGGGMRTVMRSGVLDGGAVMFIRGLNSITADAQPLVVLDGIELDMQRDRYSLHDGQYNNILSNISPDDVEKVTVLKNATALYGSRGANGVVLIDTKRGRSMATRIDANVSAGVTFVPSLPTMMDATQYRAYASELLGTIDGIGNMGIDFRFLNSDPNRLWNKIHTYDNNTDWTKEVYRAAVTQNYSINVQGGDDIGMYNLSVGYVNAKYAAKKNSFERMNVRFNTDINILWNLKTKFDISISRVNNNVLDNSLPEDFTQGTIVSPTVLGLIKSPIVSPYQRDNFGNMSSLYSDYDDIFKQLDDVFGYNSTLANPTAILDYAEGNNKNRAENTFFNVRVEPVLNLGKGFNLTGMFSYTLNRNAQRYFRPYTSVPSFNIAGLGRVYSKAQSMFAKENNFVGKLQMDWARQYGKHSVAVFVGGRFNSFSYDNNDVAVQATSKENDKNPSLSWTGPKTVFGVNDSWRQIQWYANGDYNYMNRYFATVSLMAEANSRFGKDASGLKAFGVKWAFFPSVQLGWVMTNESWFPKNDGINYLRLNAGFDISGNDGISNYAARTSYTTVRFNYNAIGTQLTNIGNDKIQWESTKKLNVGLETYLVNNRIGFKFDYYKHWTNNLLTLKAFTTPIAGINRYWSNGGKLTNDGFEATVTFKPVVSKDWNVEVGASVGHYKNKVTELPDGDYTTSAYGDNNILTSVGNPVALFYGYKTDGVFADDAAAKAAGKGTYLYMEDDAKVAHNFVAGDVHFVDLNGDGKIDEKDKTVIGDPNPDIYGNIFASVNWKNLRLDLGFNYSLGNDVFNYQRMVLNSGSNFYNQQVAEVGRWRYEGQQTAIPRATYGDPMGNNRFSDRWIEDGSYLRLKTVKLTYRLPIPGSWTWLQGLSVWAEGQNLFTLTKYLGSDPEFAAANSVLYQGIDNGSLAPSRSVVAGLKINL